MRRSHRGVSSLLTSVVFTAALVVVAAPWALAGTINVNTQADDYGGDPGSCSLREAVKTANDDANFGGCTGASGADMINLPAGTYTLSIGPAGDDANVSGDLDVSSDVTLHPTGVVTIDGTTLDRVIDISSGATLTASDLTITRGNTAAGGGGIRNLSGTLALSGVTLNDNQGAQGGAIFNDGTATLRNTTLSGNRAVNDGGGLYNSGTATMNNVTVAENSADNDADNTGEGGGIFVTLGTVNVTNSIAGDNVDRSTGANPKHNDCSGTLTSGGYNLVEDTTGCTIGGTTTGNVTGVTPGIEALADNGGPTKTHGLKKNSAALDTANPASPGSGGGSCEATDQRGVKRPQGPRCDIGSFEREAAGAKCLGVPVTITGTSGPDTLTGTQKKDGIVALAGDDTISAQGNRDGVCAGDGNDLARGDDGNDKVTGQAGKDRVVGGAGDDLIKGAGGNDRLRGQKQNDTLRGGGGNDRLNGGPGFDVCKGGPGRDRFRRCEERG